MIGKHFLDIMMHSKFMGHQSYVLLCTETTLSNNSKIKLRRPSIKKSLAKSKLVISISSIFKIMLKFYELQHFKLSKRER